MYTFSIETVEIDSIFSYWIVNRTKIIKRAVLSLQCDQMARLFVQWLAVYNNYENTKIKHKIIKNCHNQLEKLPVTS